MKLPGWSAALLVFVLGCSGEDSDGGAGGGGAAAHSGGAGNSGGTGNGGSTGNGSGGGTNGTGGTGQGQPGVSPDLGGCAMFPADNPWNTDISGLPVHPNSEAFVASIGVDTNLHPDFGTEWLGDPIGIPFTTVTGDQAPVPVSFLYDEESDPGPYPIPDDAPIEAGGDRHVLVVETTHCVLYELFAAVKEGDGWSADSGAVFDLSSNELRPDRWTSADAAGLPILPGLVRYDEVVEKGEINHALRFTVSQTQRAYINPATHAASDSTNPNHPPMGLRMRMKPDFDCSSYTDEVQVICAALKKYGMFVADNGSNWYVSGAHDPRWSDEKLNDLKTIPGSAFEAVDTGPAIDY